MPIPDHQDFMLPLLEAVADENDHRNRSQSGESFWVN
jgi:hypothetical protein